jgi:hypothetical protein
LDWRKQVNFKEKIDTLLKENMTEKGFKLWLGVDSMIPDIWNRPSSSTGKYHQKHDGSVPDIAEHTYEMLYACVKTMRMLNIFKNTSRGDAMLLSVALHDRLKYGPEGTNPHTTKFHDRDIADLLRDNSDTLRKVIDIEDVVMMVEVTRFHAGQWSFDIKDKTRFSFSNFMPETQFVHTLDMLSTAACLKLPEE